MDNIHNNATHIVGDGLNLPFKRKSLDTIIIFGLDLNKLNSVKDILKDDGNVIVSFEELSPFEFHGKKVESYAIFKKNFKIVDEKTYSYRLDYYDGMCSVLTFQKFLIGQKK